MASNTALIAVKDRGRLDGFGPLWRKESCAWWGTWSWLVKILMWVVIIDGILALATMGGPMVEAVETGQVVSQAETGPAGTSPAETSPATESLEQTSQMVFFLMTAMLPAAYVIIFGENTLIDERKLGTAAWVLSKPVSRAAFLLSKLFAHALGVLGTMVVVQGVVAYFIYKAATGISLSFPGFLAGMGLISLFLISVLALILMLGTLFNSRGPLLGISTAFISGNVLAALAVPGLSNVMPAYMFFSPVSGQPPLAVILAQGQPLPTVMPDQYRAYDYPLRHRARALRMEVL
jgi:ABC-2 type transport system permease protein